MENENISSEERLKQLNAERKELKEKVFIERTQRLKQAENMRAERDLKQEAIREKLNLVSKAIYTYNKLGKVEKDKCIILETIKAIIEEEEEEVNPDTTNSEEEPKPIPGTEITSY